MPQMMPMYWTLTLLYLTFLMIFMMIWMFFMSSPNILIFKFEKIPHEWTWKW